MRGVSRTLVSLFAALLLDRQWRLAIAAHGAVVATASVRIAVAICGYAAVCRYAVCCCAIAATGGRGSIQLLAAIGHCSALWRLAAMHPTAAAGSL